MRRSFLTSRWKKCKKKLLLQRMLESKEFSRVKKVIFGKWIFWKSRKNDFVFFLVGKFCTIFFRFLLNIIFNCLLFYFFPLPSSTNKTVKNNSNISKNALSQMASAFNHCCSLSIFGCWDLHWSPKRVDKIQKFPSLFLFGFSDKLGRYHVWGEWAKQQTSLKTTR